MKPRYIRIYDNGGETADRYTVVYTRKTITNWHRGHWFLYVGMSEAPFHPQGVCMHGEHEGPIDRPTHGHLGRKITWDELPDDCKEVVWRDYTGLWNITDRRTSPLVI